MNKGIGYFAIGTIILDLAAVAYGAYYVHKTKQQLESELDDVKTETNKTIHKIGKALSSFQV